ncbi:MAG: sigma-70 family RNA polymerase sigma factor [Planctomycetota bacterium]
MMEADSGMTRESLLSRARRQDSLAWAELVDLYGPLIAHWCGRCGLDSHATSDVIQEVFSAVSRSLATFQPQRREGSFRAWLWTITSNKIRDRARQTARNAAGEGGSTAMHRIHAVADPISVPDSEPSEEGAINELLARGMGQIREEFAERSWEIFQRAVVDGVTTAKVAEEFGVSAAAVRQTRSRILRRLREHLGDLM